MEFPEGAGAVGLKNLGNTCFMNAGLQCLSHLEPFAAYFLCGHYEEDINLENALGCRGELARAFAELQRELWRPGAVSSGASAHNPCDLHKKLRGFAPHLFEGYEQQDVQEFLAFCLDGLHEDLNRVARRPPPASEAQEK